MDMIYIFEKNGVFQACRDNRYKFRFVEPDENVIAGTGSSEDRAIDQMKALEDADASY